MQEIKAYKLSNGKVYEDKKLAQEAEKDLVLSSRLHEFWSDMEDRSDIELRRNDLVEMMVENQDKLIKIFNSIQVS